jgi:hypothetical protein
MRKQAGLTRVDIAVALACVALVLAQAGMINTGGRQRAKREVCLANMRSLTAAWQMYADDNAGKIVNGVTQNEGFPQCNQCPTCPVGAPYISKAKAPDSTGCFGNSCGHLNELPWVGGAYSGTKLPECAVKCAIETGALFKYVKDFEVYRCPTGNKGELITYNVVDGMNGMPCPPSCSRSSDNILPGWQKNRNQIRKTASQIVFIDEGRVTPDSFAVYYGTSSGYAEKWFDPPEVRHGEGTILSFVDTHAEYWKWSKETAEFGRLGAYNQVPLTPPGKQDLYKVQIGCWGKLGYNPTIPINVN